MLVKVTADDGTVSYGEAHHGQNPTVMAEIVQGGSGTLVVVSAPFGTEGNQERALHQQVRPPGLGAGSVIVPSGTKSSLGPQGKFPGQPVYQLLDGAQDQAASPPPKSRDRLSTVGRPPQTHRATPQPRHTDWDRTPLVYNRERLPVGSLRLGGTEMSKRFPALTILLLLILFPLHASPFKSSIFYHGPRLADEAIDYLSGLAREPRGAEKVGKYLAKELLTNEGREEALLRIAIRNRVISEDEAMGFFQG